MHRQQSRIKFWILVVLLLIGLAFYLSTKKSISTPNFSSSGVTATEKHLLFLSDSKTLIDYSFQNKTKKELKSAAGYEILFAASQNDHNYLLVEKANLFTIAEIDTQHDSISTIKDLTDLKPTKVFSLQNGGFAVVGGDGEKSLFVLDAGFNQLWSKVYDNRVSAVSSDSTVLSLTVSVYNDQQSQLLLTPRDTVTTPTDSKFTGIVYRLDADNLIYAKKTIDTTVLTSDPAGQTTWMIAKYDLNTKTETILTDGSFDSNPILFPQASDLAGKGEFVYQKMYGQNDQTLGQVEYYHNNQSELIDKGTPYLIY